ncbi:alternate-type signal peptide domain-containing protein [Microbacterium sp. F2E]|uniref:alternate-type signal peptide domain-containing protein n=1 Tax=Microbacterium sp. F2E TaxID=2895284 RepID=UPI001E336B6A|nr:alternate-type signal peptide domain-containing protein [Microbacterium sp. F2E]MCC9053337.1 alternate-type signal peptide domain-containing protein [Microbacterium sp. F2E]
MNKLAKGSVAAGVAVLLLLGGGGSLAYWNDKAGLTGAQIEAGELTLAVEDGAWSDDIALWVPGDTDTYTANLSLTATGDHMKGEITVDQSSIVFAPTTASSAFTVTFAPNGTLPAGVTYNSTTKTFSFSGAVTADIPVKVTVAFPYGTAVDNTTQGATVQLSDIAFTATQLAP